MASLSKKQDTSVLIFKVVIHMITFVSAVRFSHKLHSRTLLILRINSKKGGMQSKEISRACLSRVGYGTDHLILLIFHPYKDDRK